MVSLWIDLALFNILLMISTVSIFWLCMEAISPTSRSAIWRRGILLALPYFISTPLRKTSTGLTIDSPDVPAFYVDPSAHKQTLACGVRSLETFESPES
jgi:hypothetical protein